MKSSILGLIVWILIAFSAGAIGSQFMPGAWYASLAKPSWNPPNWIFGPVWTVLYVMMGVAAWTVWRSVGLAGARTALVWFFAQLVLNALWSYLFFGAHRPLLAFVEICALWLAILVTVMMFARIKPLAGVLLVPYLLWVSFASILNFQLWRMNA